MLFSQCWCHKSLLKRWTAHFVMKLLTSALHWAVASSQLIPDLCLLAFFTPSDSWKLDEATVCRLLSLSAEEMSCKFQLYCFLTARVFLLPCKLPQDILLVKVYSDWVSAYDTYYYYTNYSMIKIRKIVWLFNLYFK